MNEPRNEGLIFRGRSIDSNDNLLMCIKHLFISSNQHFDEDGWEVLLFPFHEWENQDQSKGRTGSGFYSRRSHNSSWNSKFPALWPFCGIVFPLPLYPRCQTHTHTPQFKQNLGCLIYFKTNLKAIYVFCLQTERNHRLNLCDCRSEPAGDYFVSKTDQSRCPQNRPRRGSGSQNAHTTQMIRKATEIRKPWSPF